MLGNSKLIAELQEKITLLEADQTAAAAAKAALQAELEAHKTGLAALRAALAAANNGSDAAEEEDDNAACIALAALLTPKAGIEAEVTRRLASAGVDPVKRDPAVRETKSMPRAEFSQLSPSAQSAWFSSGGKVSE